MPDTLCHDIFVVVDPRSELSEYNEGNNSASKEWCCYRCGSNAFILPAVQYTFWANYIGPISWTDSIEVFVDGYSHWLGPMTVDSRMAPIYIGNFDPEHQAADLDLSTIRINETIVPETCTVVPFPEDFSVPIFPGQMVLRVSYTVSEFVQWYIDTFGWLGLTDTTMIQYDVTGAFNDGTPFAICQILPMIGHTTGDVDGNEVVNVGDLTYLIGYMFRGGEEPDPPEAGDVNLDGTVNVTDLSVLTEVLFK